MPFELLQWTVTKPYRTPEFPTYGLPDWGPDPGYYVMILLVTIGLPLIACYIVYRFWSKHRETSRPPQEVIRESISTEHVIRERVLVVCPYCGAKAEQGTTFCPGCGGKL